MLLFEAGEYPDKHFSLTPEALKEVAARFVGPLDVPFLLRELADKEQLCRDMLVETTRLRKTLRTIQAWDCINPVPNEQLCADFPWLKELVDMALS